MVTPARRRPGLQRDTLGKLLARVKTEVRNKSRYHRFRLPAYYKDLSEPLQKALREELETKQYQEEEDKDFSFTYEQIGSLVVNFYRGNPVKPL